MILNISHFWGEVYILLDYFEHSILRRGDLSLGQSTQENVLLIATDALHLHRNYPKFYISTKMISLLIIQSVLRIHTYIFNMLPQRTPWEKLMSSNFRLRARPAVKFGVGSNLVSIK